MDPLFHDGQPSGLEFTEAQRQPLKEALVKAGLARWAVPEDAPGVDITGRLRPAGWPVVASNSAEHLEAAQAFGSRCRAFLAHQTLMEVTRG